MWSRGDVCLLVDGVCQFLGDLEELFWFLFNFTFSDQKTIIILQTQPTKILMPSSSQHCYPLRFWDY